MDIPEDVIISEQLKYTPPNEVLTHAQKIARERFAKSTDKGFMLMTLGLKTAFDLLNKMVYDDGMNELAGALEVITLLCSVDNSRYYDLLATFTDELTSVGAVRNDPK